MFHKYIDSNNFEIRNDIFEVDEKIAETISLLNKKGYKTLNSCAGHDQQTFIKDIIYKTKDGLKTIQEGEEISVSEKEIERLKNDPLGVDIIEKDDKYIIYYEITGISTYISFDKDYKFKTIPDGFEKNPSWDSKKNRWSKTNFDGISKNLKFYNKNGKRKSKQELEKEINKNNIDLYEWAKKLPSLI